MITAILHSKIWKNQLHYALCYWIYIPVLVILSGKVVDILFGLPALPHNRFTIAVGVLLLASGIALIWRSMRDLSVYGEGTANPLRPPRKLVTEGCYAICRHPMFLGYDMAALGVVILMRSPGMLFISYLLFIAYEICFLKKEENILALRFHDAFEDYRKRVSFLIPIKFRRINK